MIGNRDNRAMDVTRSAFYKNRDLGDQVLKSPNPQRIYDPTDDFRHQFGRDPFDPPFDVPSSPPPHGNTGPAHPLATDSMPRSQTEPTAGASDAVAYPDLLGDSVRLRIVSSPRRAL